MSWALRVCFRRTSAACCEMVIVRYLISHNNPCEDTRDVPHRDLLMFVSPLGRGCRLHLPQYGLRNGTLTL